MSNQVSVRFSGALYSQAYSSSDVDDVLLGFAATARLPYPPSLDWSNASPTSAANLRAFLKLYVSHTILLFSLPINELIDGLFKAPINLDGRYWDQVDEAFAVTATYHTLCFNQGDDVNYSVGNMISMVNDLMHAIVSDSVDSATYNSQTKELTVVLNSRVTADRYGTLTYDIIKSSVTKTMFDSDYSDIAESLDVRNFCVDLMSADSFSDVKIKLESADHHPVSTGTSPFYQHLTRDVIPYTYQDASSESGKVTKVVIDPNSDPIKYARPNIANASSSDLALMLYQLDQLYAAYGKSAFLQKCRANGTTSAYNLLHYYTFGSKAFSPIEYVGMRRSTENNPAYLDPAVIIPSTYDLTDLEKIVADPGKNARQYFDSLTEADYDQLYFDNNTRRQVIRIHQSVLDARPTPGTVLLSNIIRNRFSTKGLSESDISEIVSIIPDSIHYDEVFRYRSDALFVLDSDGKLMDYGPFNDLSEMLDARAELQAFISLLSKQQAADGKLKDSLKFTGPVAQAEEKDTRSFWRKLLDYLLGKPILLLILLLIIGIVIARNVVKPAIESKNNNNQPK